MSEDKDTTGVREEALTALETLSSEHRLAILRALADASGPVSFSELRQRVGIEDAGLFNYHLTELCERFVTETERGYDLGYRGERVVLAAGDTDPETGPVDQEMGERVCPVCGEPECERLIHVHLGRWTPGDASSSR